MVLAGGLARRMGLQDKGLILFDDKPLVSYALAAMAPLTGELLVSANRNQEVYRQFGYPVISDANNQFDGPLAGILAAMKAARHPTLLIMPCDSPLIKTEHLERILEAFGEGTDIAAAYDGQRLHPVFAALKVHIRNDLQQYLQSGERKLQSWFERHSLTRVDFSDKPEIFANINTPEELQALEQAERCR